jgi:hypothetical protein
MPASQRSISANGKLWRQECRSLGIVSARRRIIADASLPGTIASRFGSKRKKASAGAGLTTRAGRS